ncbi:MAG: SBBP repeat-containing protein [bacterium]
MCRDTKIKIIFLLFFFLCFTIINLANAGDLIYSTFLGGFSGDYGFSVAVDTAGNAYVTGYTLAADFPVTAAAFDTSSNGMADVFISKVNDTGSALIYSTYLGGSSNDYGQGICVDSDGNAYITGHTYSNNFPTTSGAYDTTYNGGEDTFISKLNKAGTALVYSTFIGGSNDDYGSSIAIDTAGNAYITGGTESANDFPITLGAFDTTHNGDFDVFISKLNPDGSMLIYSTFLGGSTTDSAISIAVDSSGNVYIGGATSSSDFPTTSGAYDTTLNGNIDIFISKLDTTGTAMVYSSFFGGSSTNYFKNLCIDTSGNVYITGYTYSSDFPITPGALDTVYHGGGDIFISKFSNIGSTLIYSCLFGSSSSDIAYGIDVDTVGYIYISGMTYSPDFPVTAGAFDTTYHGAGDVFVSELNANCSALIHSTFLGGSGTDQAYDIKLDPDRNTVITGHTGSMGFPITPGAFDTTYNSSDAYVSKLLLHLTPNFYGTPLISYAPLTTQFEDLSFGNPTSWSWSFGDGSTSNEQNPVHIFATAGIYTVSLMVQNKDEAVTKTIPNYIEVYATLPPIADFYSTPTTVITPMTIQFYDTSSSRPPNNWFWSFGDGSTSLLQNPTHKYNTAGLYTVSLIASNPYGANTAIKNNYILVYDTTQNRIINTTGTTQFYLATWGSTTDYTPVTFNVTALTGIDTVRITVFDKKYPYARSYAGDTLYISRYFKVAKVGTSIITTNITLLYTAADSTDAHLTGEEKNVDVAVLYGLLMWRFISPIRNYDNGLYTATVNDISYLSGDWTVSAPSGVAIELSNFSTNADLILLKKNKLLLQK